MEQTEKKTKIGKLVVGGIGLQCNAACMHDPTDELLLASCVGPESAVKAFRAMLHLKKDKHPIEIRDMDVYFTSRRAWRIGQRQLCKVVYLYYKDTMQELAMNLMSNKMAASKALEGEFSSEGLAALTEGDSAEMALAKTLVGRIRHKATQRAWQKV